MIGGSQAASHNKAPASSSPVFFSKSIFRELRNDNQVFSGNEVDFLYGPDAFVVDAAQVEYAVFVGLKKIYKLQDGNQLPFVAASDVLKQAVILPAGPGRSV